MVVSYFRLPQDIHMTSKVAKILLLLEKGKGKEFKGRSLSDIELGREIYYSSESETEVDQDKSLPLLKEHYCDPQSSQTLRPKILGIILTQIIPNK